MALVAQTHAKHWCGYYMGNACSELFPALGFKIRGVPNRWGQPLRKYIWYSPTLTLLVCACFLLLYHFFPCCMLQSGHKGYCLNLHRMFVHKETKTNVVTTRPIYVPGICYPILLRFKPAQIYLCIFYLRHHVQLYNCRTDLPLIVLMLDAQVLMLHYFGIAHFYFLLLACPATHFL